MIAKRPSEKIRKAGIVDVYISCGKYGFTPLNPDYQRQHSVCWKTSEEAVEQVLKGFRPTEVKHG